MINKYKYIFVTGNRIATLSAEWSPTINFLLIYKITT